MKRLHLMPALVVFFLAVWPVAGFDVYATRIEDRYAGALAADSFHQKSLGTAMIQATLKQPELLPMFGSSEISSGDEYNAAVLFGTYPTGFGVSRIGFKGQPLLAMTLQLAGAGSSLRGKKVIIMVDLGTLQGAGDWPGSFSALHANELVFSRDLSFGLKQRIVAALLSSKRPPSQDPLLEFGLERLAGGTILDRAAYYAILPLGLLHVSIMRLQDHWEVLSYIRDHPELQTDVQRRPADLQWPSLAADVASRISGDYNGNPFYMLNSWWDKYKDSLLSQKKTSNDAKFGRAVRAPGAWTDLELTLMELEELGAQPLLVGMPLHGPFYDYKGITKLGRQAYYERFSRLGRKYGAKVVTLQDHEYDKYFFDDTGEHASPEGWIYIDQVIDSFYHDDLR